MSEDSRIQGTTTPTLHHPDFHKRNIFISEDDPTAITAIIDWQSSAVEPAFWYADQIPDFANSVPHPSLDNQLEPNSELCSKTFHASIHFLLPRLVRPMAVDEAMFRPFRYSHRTWKDGIVGFRHDLIETARHWDKLGLPGTYPFPVPTPKELESHQIEYQRFLAAQNLKNDLANLLDCATDGWVRPEDWDSTKLAHKKLFQSMLEAVLSNENPDDDEPIRSEEDLRDIWPSDLEGKAT